MEALFCYFKNSQSGNYVPDGGAHNNATRLWNDLQWFIISKKFKLLADVMPEYFRKIVLNYQSNLV